MTLSLKKALNMLNGYDGDYYYGVRSVSIIANAHRETHKCKHKDSKMRTEQFTNIFTLQMHAERFTNTFQCTRK